MSLSAYLAALDERWNPAESMVIAVVKSPGYHTRIPDGANAHWTKEAMDYAIANFGHGGSWRVERGNQILQRVLGLQVTNPLDPHFGIWGWFMEEPPEKMAPADWNWADFIGARIAQILVRHSDAVARQLLEPSRESLRMAAWAIFRRNCGLGYTNIAVMGGVVCAIAGEILGDALLLDYGRRRLMGVVALAKRSGGFSEYNSPTYTRVALEETERALMLVKDPATRHAAEELRVIAWRTIAGHFHPGTGQVSGPQSRAYSDRIEPGLARYLSEQTGTLLGRSKVARPEESWTLVDPIACPPEITGRFRHLPSDPLEVRHRYSDNPYIETVGTSWFTADACLGSVTRGFGWVQQRAVLGYWRLAEDQPACLRVRVLKDGKDFASSYLWSAQSGPHVLTAVSIVSDSGSHHITLDKPPGGMFTMSDLRVRVELTGHGARVSRMDGGRMALECGAWRAVIHPAAPGSCEFEERDVTWTTEEQDGSAVADVILYCGNERSLDTNVTGLRLAFALEVLTAGEVAEAAVPQFGATERSDGVTWRWRGLEVFGRTGPVPFAW